MIIKTSSGESYSVNMPLPNCRCVHWARMWNGAITIHNPSCSKVEEEISENGFIRYPSNGDFICRTFQGKAEDFIYSANNFGGIFYSRECDCILVDMKDLVDCRSLEDVQQSILSFYESDDRFQKVDSVFLVIDRMLYVYYYDGESYLFHEIYSYVEDQIETQLMNH